MQALNLYGAAGIVSFGWAVCERFGVRSGEFVPLWFAGALLIYNVDRLRHDPADAINAPERVRQFRRFRPASRALCWVAAATLLAWPVLRRDWLLLFFIASGTLFSLSYSIPLFGRRLKDLAGLKTFVPPAVITVACLAPVLLRSGEFSNGLLSGAVVWVWCFLMFNMIVCDLRDLDGDRSMGTQTIPVWLGRSATRRVLIGFAISASVIAWILHWRSLAVSGALVFSTLLVALRTPRPEAFYEWLVEGALFVPACVRLGEFVFLPRR